MRRRAVFLDRDGVITPLAPDEASGLWEGPRRPQEAGLAEGAAEAIKSLAAAGYMIFVVSNQPNYAKGKSSLEDLRLIHEKIESGLSAAGARVDEFFYCYHHPSGDKPGYSRPCECRKPKPYFLLKAGEKYGLDMKRSWLVGDRAGDIDCGHSAGVRTVLVKSRQGNGETARHAPFATAVDLREAAAIILGTVEDR